MKPGLAPITQEICSWLLYGTYFIVYFRMLSPKTKRNIARIIPFGVLWLVFSILYTLLEKGLLGKLDYYPSTGNAYNFKANILATPVSASIMGLLIGVLEIRYFSKWFIQKSFSKKIIFKSIIYVGLILIFLLFNFLFIAGWVLKDNTAGKFPANLWGFITSYSLWSIVIYIAAIVVVTQFYTEVSESFGHGVLKHFFTGKYYKPVEEKRIFMFLDMRSSTTIAENLGHIKYFEMLREYFADLSDPVIKYAGEIYQYAGDEIIVSWKLNNGLQNNNFLECFFAMKTALKAQANKYNERFGLLPEFKAGFHFGLVTTGEIGVLKKEIIFTGDVLNTTARIQSLCNMHKTDILVSAALVQQLCPAQSFQLKSVGGNELKGKDGKMELFTIALYE